MPSAEKRIFSPSSRPPCPCMQATYILRDVLRALPPLESCKPGKRWRRACIPPRIACRILLSTANVSRDTFVKIAHPRPPLFLFFSLIQHGMARRMPSPVLFDHYIAAVRKGAPVTECIPPISETHRKGSSRVFVTRRSDDRTLSSRVSFVDEQEKK